MARPASFNRLGAALAAAVLASLLPASAARGARPRPSREQALRVRLHSLAFKRALKRQQLRTTRRAQRRLSQQLNESYRRLERTTAELRVSEARLDRAARQVNRATTELRAAEARRELQRTRFRRRVALAYTAGPATVLDALLGARSLTDLMDRGYYVQRLAEADGDLLSHLRQAQDQVARRRERLVVRRAELADAREETAERVAGVTRQTASREALLARIRRERALLEQRLAELEEDSREVQRALERELARRLAHPSRFRRLPRWSGRRYPPAQGRIVSGFGYRYHPILRARRMHTGIDIAAAPGAPVSAAAAGEVFHASWRGGYGQCIILLHGGGMSTLYGHLSNILVAPGQSVRRGQVIGAVGSTGLATGPHLHFEVRRNGVPVDPR